jgi:hypothetical protein
LSRDRDRGRAEWQPTYPVWAPAVAVSTLAAGLAAPVAESLVTGGPSRLTLGAILDVGRGDAAGLTPMALAVLAMATILASVPPGLLSLFLITLTELRLRFHPVAGAVTFGVLGMLLAQSFAPAVFGFVFGLVSLGGTAAILALHRHFAGGKRA